MDGHGINGCGQSGYRAQKLTVSQKWMEWTDFLPDGGNSGKLKVDSITFGWFWLKMGVSV